MEHLKFNHLRTQRMVGKRQPASSSNRMAQHRIESYMIFEHISVDTPGRDWMRLATGIKPQSIANS